MNTDPLGFAAFVARIEAAIRQPLPGAAAHQRLAPARPREWPPGFDPAHVRHAAALLLVFPVGGRPHIPLTLRAHALDRHGGQVSLPGGVIDPGETFEAAALREAHEEIGLSLDEVRVCGALTPLDIPVSGFRLHPIVAASFERPALIPSDGEVAAILEVAVDDLLDPERLVLTSRVPGGRGFPVPAFRVGGTKVWGATAMVLAEFVALAVDGGL